MASMIPTWGAKMASNNLSSSHIHFNPTDSWQPGDCSANVGETVRSSAADTIDLRWDLRNSDEQIKMSHEAVCCLCALHAQTEICANCQSSSRNAGTFKRRSVTHTTRSESRRRSLEEGELSPNFRRRSTTFDLSARKRKSLFVTVSSVCSNCSTTRWLH